MEVPISALPAAAALTGAELVPLVQGGVTKAALASTLIGPPGPTNNHVLSGGAAPTASYQAADGGSVTSIGGTDSAGRVAVLTGAGFAVSTDTVRVLFHTAWNSPPAIAVTPGDSASAAIPLYAKATTTYFEIFMASAAPLTNYSWVWLAIGSPN